MPGRKDKRAARITVVVISAVFTFALLFGGNLWVENRTVTRPLERILASVEGVTRVRVSEESGQVVVDAEIGVVPDLRTTYQEIHRKTQDLIGKRRFTINIKDRRNPALEEAYYSIHFDLQQAISTGGFSAMAAAIRERAPGLGVDRHRVYVDGEFIFVQLHAGSDYLYEILSRTGSNIRS